ncbi:uncharacterized protein isoform X5 [Macaca fascicularis]|uniref:uncharacterized protein isoform X5 n=1 Tax=Macaca fascicularis TaxID=9541 RepID=UPI003D157791
MRLQMCAFSLLPTADFIIQIRSRNHGSCRATCNGTFNEPFPVTLELVSQGTKCSYPRGDTTRHHLGSREWALTGHQTCRCLDLGLPSLYDSNMHWN